MRPAPAELGADRLDYLLEEVKIVEHRDARRSVSEHAANHNGARIRGQIAALLADPTA